jgi:hypothetical protein
MFPVKPPVVSVCAVIILTFLACTRHTVEVAPIEVKPIHITVDVNVKVDRALDNFFDDLDQSAQKIKETPSLAK